MIVIIAGMPRSGSTFSFNIARELLQARGTTAWASDNSLPPQAERPRVDHFILKSHQPDPQVCNLISSGQAKAICTYRKPEDAVASWAGTFGFSVSDSIASILGWLRWHAGQTGTSDIDYRTIESDPLAVIIAIQACLLGSVEEQEARRLLERHNKRATYAKVVHMEKGVRMVDIGFSYYDPESFLHRGHVRSEQPLVAEDTLSAGEFAQVREALAPFVGTDGLYRPA
ncbi:MAG TPA: hypothetical protein VF169_11650 [Albitalea sp.]|uniref:hypothetical protein n=1 Tax=Piscinibacter sp. TaxID=1903157 RepID=UPI002ED4B898